MQPSAPSGRAYPELGQPQQAIPHLKAALPIDDGDLAAGQAELAKAMLNDYQGIVKSAAVANQSRGASSADCATLEVWPVYYTSYRS